MKSGHENPINCFLPSRYCELIHNFLKTFKAWLLCNLRNLVQITIASVMPTIKLWKYFFIQNCLGETVAISSFHSCVGRQQWEWSCFDRKLVRNWCKFQPLQGRLHQAVCQHHHGRGYKWRQEKAVYREFEFKFKEWGPIYPKRLSYQLLSSKVNIFARGWPLHLF